MNSFRLPGTLLLAEALGRAMREWSPEAWKSLRPDVRDSFDGGVQLKGFQLIALANQAAVQETYGRLRTLLSQGALPSRARVPQGPPVPIPADAWEAGAADRLGDVLAGRVRMAGPDSAGDVLISASNLEAALAGRVVAGSKPSATAVDSPALTRNTGGKPPRHDLVRFLGIAARILYDHDPATPAELRRLTLDAYAATLPAGAEPPSDEWAKPHIRTFLEGYETRGKRSG